MFTSLIAGQFQGVGGSGSSTPSTQSSSLTFHGIKTLRVGTRGNGSRILVVMKSGAAVDSHPVDNTSYTAAAFGSGSQLGTGNYVVYNGTDVAGVNLIIEGLSYGISYGCRVYEFNGLSGFEAYNTTTATNNPITATTPSALTYLKYNDTPFQTRREPYNLKTISRAFSQLYCIGAWTGAAYFHAWFVSEGDGDNLGGIDRSTHAKCPIASDPTVKTNWVWDSPVNSDGDVPAFLDKATLTYTSANFQGVWAAGTYQQNDEVRYIGSSNDFIYRSNINNNTSTPPTNWTDITPWNGNQNWGNMSVVSHAGTLYGLFVGNRYIANDYGVGMCYSTDEWATKTILTNPIIAIGSQINAFYVKVHPTKISGFWYMFMQNPTLSLIAEDHLHCLQIWRTSSDPTTSGWTGWTKITTVDQLSSRGYGGGVDISQSWDEGGKFRAYISPNVPGSTVGGYQAKYEGETAFLTTNPVGDWVDEIEWTDWTNFQQNFYVYREAFRDSQITQIETRTWGPKMTFGADTFFIGTGFLWKGQTALNGILEIEPMNDAKIVSTKTGGVGTVTVGNDVYPDWARLGLPHRSHLVDTLGSTDIRPYDAIGNTAGTIVGAPKVARCNCIQPVSGGYVTFPQANWSLNTSKNAFKILVGRNNNADNSYGIINICGQVEYYRDSNSVFRIIARGASGLYKEITVNYDTYKAFNDATQLAILGHYWDAGTFVARIDYALNPTVTTIHNDSFSALISPSTDLIIGTVGADYSKDVVGSFLKFDGANATDDHYLNNNIIAY